MKTIRYTEAQILAILRQAEGGMPVAELCRAHGMSSASFDKWRTKYGGMDAPLISQMKAIEDENRRLKRIYARHIALGDEIARLKVDRIAAVTTAIQMDPAYVPQPEGLIASAVALETLAAQSPWLKSRILAVIVALVLLDLAALEILLLTPAPPVYAALLACLQQNEIGRLIAEACAQGVRHASERAKALSAIYEVEDELEEKRRQREQRAWFDAMFAEKLAERHEVEPAA